MKLQKVKKALTHKTIRIVTDADGYQWVGDHHAMYLADKALDITEGNIKAILDIDEDQRDKWTVFADSGREMPWFDQCPIELADDPLRAIVSVSWMGELVTVFSTQEGDTAMIPQTLIAPADGKEGLTFALRRWTDPETGETQEPLVVCFCDMLANAILTPLPRKTADEIWRAMRDASAEGLRYCREDKEDEK